MFSICIFFIYWAQNSLWTESTLGKVLPIPESGPPASLAFGKRLVELDPLKEEQSFKIWNGASEILFRSRSAQTHTFWKFYTHTKDFYKM